jgi:transposase
MGEMRQHCNEEFRLQTVKYIQEQTKNMPDIAEELNIPVGTLRQWLAQYRQFDGEPSVERVRQLEQQLKEKERQLAEKDRELEDACDTKKPPEGLIHHSVRGSQYASHEYQQQLSSNKMQVSMNR